MEYKGIKYTIAQTIPLGWKWTVHLADGNTREGEASTRAAAVLDAEIVIDLSQPSRESIIGKEESL
jgi:hypothetical protein